MMMMIMMIVMFPVAMYKYNIIGSNGRVGIRNEKIPIKIVQ
jgi:hypothetical protein